MTLPLHPESSRPRGALRLSFYLAQLSGGRSQGDPALRTASYVATNYLITLPNGRILSLGGQKIPKLYDPVTNAWQSVDTLRLTPDTTPPRIRGWHSAAALLPDARVLIAGGGTEGTDDDVSASLSIYNPPYLYRNCSANGCEFLGTNHPARPVIESVPPLIATGSTFVASVSPGSDATGIASACLIRPGSATHSVEFDQRFIDVSSPSLLSGAGPGGPPFVAPRSADDAPPGYYMFFAVNDQGVPAVAKFVQVWGIVRSSVKVTMTQFCSGQMNLNVSWLTSMESDTGVMDQVDFYPPGGCGSSPITRQALPPSDRRSHSVTYSGSFQAGLWCVTLRSQRAGTETKLESEQVVAQTTEVPSVIETSMSAWSEENPYLGEMTLHFYFGTTQCATEFEVQVRPSGTGSWTTLTCASPSSSCIFNSNNTYERTKGWTCETQTFEWRAKATNWNGSSDYSSIKGFHAYCLE